MKKPKTFEVHIETAGKPEIEGIYQDEKIALERAEFLLGLAKYTAIAVHQIDSRGTDTVIFEKRANSQGKSAGIAEIDQAFACASIDQVYGYPSRKTLVRLLRGYCDEQMIIPAELLHQYMTLRMIERDQLLFNQGLHRLAALQARELRIRAEQRHDQLTALFRDVLALAKEPDASVLEAARQFSALSFSEFLAFVRRSFPEAEEARVVTFAVSRHLEEKRDWPLKIEALCDLFSEDQSPEAEVWLDELLAETLDGNAVIRAAIGYAPDLATALTSLAGVLDGSLDSRNAATPCLMKLNDIMAFKPLPTVREVFVSRIAAALDGLALLTKTGREGDAAAFWQLVPMLREAYGFMGGAAMAAALTRRVKIVERRKGADLSYGEAVEAILNVLPGTGARLGYLLDLLSSGFGKKNASHLMEQVAVIFDRIRTIQDLAPAGGHIHSPDEIKENFRQRLYAAGIPRKLVDALLRKLERAILSPAPPALPSETTVALAPSAVATAMLPPSAEITVMLPAAAARPARSRLTLLYGGTTVVVEPGRRAFVIGRQPVCDLVIDDEAVAGVHAVVVIRDGRFVLLDQSLRSTCVQFAGTASTLVLDRSITELNGAGIIAPGRTAMPVAGEQAPLIGFKVSA